MSETGALGSVEGRNDRTSEGSMYGREAYRCCAFKRRETFDPVGEEMRVKSQSGVVVRHSNSRAMRCSGVHRITTNVVAIGTQSGRIAFVTGRCNFPIALPVGLLLCAYAASPLA